MPNHPPRNSETRSKSRCRYPTARSNKSDPSHTYWLDTLGTIRGPRRSTRSPATQSCSRSPTTQTARAPALHMSPPSQTTRRPRRPGETPNNDTTGVKTERSVVPPQISDLVGKTLIEEIDICSKLLHLNVGLVSQLVEAQRITILWPKSIYQHMSQNASLPLLVGPKDQVKTNLFDVLFSRAEDQVQTKDQVAPLDHPAYFEAGRRPNQQRSRQHRILHQPKAYLSVIHDTWNLVTPPQDTPPPVVVDSKKHTIVDVLFSRAEVTELIANLTIVATLGNRLEIARRETQDYLIAAQTIHFLSSIRAIGFVETRIRWNFQCSSSLLLLFRRPLGFFKPTTSALSRKSRVEIHNYFQVMTLFVHCRISIYQIGYFVSMWPYRSAAASLMLGDFEVVYKVVRIAMDFSRIVTNLVDIFTSKSFDLIPQQASSMAHILCWLSIFLLRNLQYLSGIYLHEDPTTILISALAPGGRQLGKSLWIMHGVILYLLSVIYLYYCNR